MTRYAVLLLVIFLQGCTATLEDYTNTKPDIDLATFFEGDFVAHGIVKNRQNRLLRSFCVELSGQWHTTQNGETFGQLDEVFYFNDGEIQTRNWQLQKITRNGKTHYTGTAEDVNGEASGKSVGQAFFWEYSLRIQLKGRKQPINVKIDDWIYQIDSHHAFNQSAIKKLGFKVGEISIFFNKLQAQCQP